jgi:hypothetical protein
MWSGLSKNRGDRLYVIDLFNERSNFPCTKFGQPAYNAAFEKDVNIKEQE